MHSALNEGSPIEFINDMFTRSKEKAKHDKKRGTVHLGGSIARYSKNLIMSFPLLCDSSIPLDTAMSISGANERNICNMLQLLFASINLNFLNKSDVTGADVIASFYKDIDPNMDYNDFVDLLSKFTGDEEGLGYYAKIGESDIKDLLDQFNSQKTFKMDSLNEKSLNDYSVTNLHGRTIVKEAPHFPVGTVGTEPGDEDLIDNVPIGDDINKAHNTASNIRKEKEQKRQNDIRNNRDRQNDLNNNQEKEMLANKSRIVASDIKKLNNLEPTLMVINYTVMDDKDKEIIDKKSFLAGVKSRFIPVESLDIVERFVSKDRTKISLKNFIRATTGEISFFKDFILSLDKLKLDAKNAAKRGPLANFWSILEKRSAKNSIRKLQRSGNDGAAITTIALSQDSVNYMKNAYNFDLEAIANAKLIIDSYNLLGLIIADESTETYKILYDGYNEFEVLSYSSVERDLSDKNYRKVINLINQVGR